MGISWYDTLMLILAIAAVGLTGLQVHHLYTHTDPSAHTDSSDENRE